MFKKKEEIERILTALGVQIGHTELPLKSRVVDIPDSFRIEYSPIDSPLRDNRFLKKVVSDRREQIVRLLLDKLAAFIAEKEVHFD
ncbi:MAG: hypothetical protein WC279_12220 [Sulfurimonas sp.]|jgi:hypothetical protein|uniref:hypothetical protein n=1 Tax=Sulfurimonas sp. TaxID=2022749 RepID=UPI003563879A